jgi:hypothetical protein
MDDNAARIWQICKECAATIYGATPPTPQYADRVARLLFGTAAQESGLQWERQRTPRWEGVIGGFGKWQCETGSINASIEYLRRRPDVCARATTFVFGDPKTPVDAITRMSEDTLLWALRMHDNDRLSCLLGRLHYFRIAAPVPADIEDQAGYWKKYFNTVAGAGTVNQYCKSWARYCMPVIGRT